VIANRKLQIANFLSVCIHAPSVAKLLQLHMRLVSYNILDGGDGRGDLLRQVISRQRPDIVVLVEADNPELVDRIAADLDMDSVRGEGNKEGTAAAILSRWPIRESINHAVLRTEISKSFLEATLIGLGDTHWVIGAVHLHARAAEEDERQREVEIGVVLDAMKRHRGARRPHLLAGDINANSPIQEIDPARCKPRTREEWDENGGRIPRRVVQRILDAGYSDSLHAIRGPAAGRMASFTTEFPGQRVDYIFTHGFPSERLRDAWIEQAEPAGKASDHYPIGIEIAEI